MIKHPESAKRGASEIRKAFDRYQEQFTEITRRAAVRFRNRDWQGMSRDALERLDLYTKSVEQIVEQVRALFPPERPRCEPVWAEMKKRYAGLITGRDDCELAETFFNSVTRRIFETVGVNPRIEFTASEFRVPKVEDRDCPVCTFHAPPSAPRPVRPVIREILTSCIHEIRFHDMARDADRVTEAVERHLTGKTGRSVIDHIEMIRSVFYRDKAAYLIGRIRAGQHVLPLVIALLDGRDGAAVDAVLLTGTESSILFSFTRACFHTEVERPSETVNFLKNIIPLKRVSEIYTSLGFHKHGKAELYRELGRHLEKSRDCFEIARGEKGMVMLVFTLPDFDVVFKIIRDRFEYPKHTSRDAVRNRYELVFRHDRAGRLVDAQEFEHMEFDRKRFSEELLDEFRQSARNTVVIEDDRVIVRHLYTERRLTPLDIYLREAPADAARDAVLDYGRAIKELAATNIFPGDLFLKNFGVTRHGRVVFYDYDELCLLTECNFRKIPESRGYDDEMSSAPWFHVDAHDVFPEEFRTFLRFPPDMKIIFEEAHADLFDVAFWQDMQEQLKSGAVMHIFPYRPESRFTRGNPPVV